MALPTKVIVPLSLLIGFLGVLIAWLGVPNEQAFPMNYPNVMMVRHTDDYVDVSPMRHDNVTIAKQSSAKFSGIYQHDLFFYHQRFRDLEKYLGEGGNYRVWECCAFCQPSLGGTSRMFLMHRSPGAEEKGGRHAWYIVEMDEQNPETPLIHARTKFRKNLEIETASWVEADTNPERKKLDKIPIQIFSIWTILKPDSWIKGICWLVGIGALALFFYFACKDDDSDF